MTNEDGNQGDVAVNLGKMVGTLEKLEAYLEFILESVPDCNVLYVSEADVEQQGASLPIRIGFWIIDLTRSISNRAWTELHCVKNICIDQCDMAENVGHGV